VEESIQNDVEELVSKIEGEFAGELVGEIEEEFAEEQEKINNNTFKKFSKIIIFLIIKIDSSFLIESNSSFGKFCFNSFNLIYFQYLREFFSDSIL